MPIMVSITRRRQLILAVVGVGLLGGGFPPQVSLAQQGSSGNPAVPVSAAPTGQYVGSFVDPNTGKLYDRYLEQQNVPIPRWEQQEVTERRSLPQWVTENLRTTEVRYVPYVEYQPQQKTVNEWNMFAPPKVIWEYVPVTRYQAINQVVERPTTYQKYIEQDVKVLVPKLVQTTESRSTYVDRERAQVSNPPAVAPNTYQNAAELAMANRNSQYSPYAMRPMDGWYSGSPAPMAMYPYSPYSSLASVPVSPYYGNPYVSNPATLAAGPAANQIGTPSATGAPVPQTSLVSNQTVIPPLTNGYPSPYAYPSANPYSTNPPYPPSVAPSNAYVATQPMFRWPAWMTVNGPLLQQEMFGETLTPPSNGTATIPSGSSYYPMVASQSYANGTLRPSTSPMVPTPSSVPVDYSNSQTYRDPMQAGLPPTVLR